MVTGVRPRVQYMRRVGEFFECKRDPEFGIVLESVKTHELWRTTPDGFERRVADAWVFDPGMSLDALHEVMGQIETWR